MSEKNNVSASVLKNIFDLDPSGDSLKDFVEIFNRTTPQRIRDLKIYAKKKDAAGVAREAHNLKSACGYLGAQKMQALCISLESQNAKTFWSGSAPTISDLEKLFKSTKAELISAVKSGGPK